MPFYVENSPMLTIKFRTPFFKFPVEEEYMNLFPYSNLLTNYDGIIVICENTPINADTMDCSDRSEFIFPCYGDVCYQKGNNSYCDILADVESAVWCRDSAGVDILLNIDFALRYESSSSCESPCDTKVNNGSLLFTYYSMGTIHECSPLLSCGTIDDMEDVPPLVYYADGNYHPTSHCKILGKPMLEIPPVLIFSDASIPPGIPFEIYLVDKLNEEKKLLRYFEFVEIPPGSKLYFEINSVELVTCYLYMEHSFTGFFAVSKLYPVISLDVIRHTYGISETEMLCEGRLNASHSTIVAYTRNTLIILESDVLWEYAIYKPEERSMKLLSLLKCDDVVFSVLNWQAAFGINFEVELQIWDLKEGKMLSNDTNENRVWFKRGNSEYAAKVKARYHRCYPYMKIERDFEVHFSFKECSGDVSIAS
ncbi:hypothetical protein T10_9482 [Trichinella papuae]|uniref:Uncharacterized protein n=1 Tax=Trichinella papuae TaxID=268474 RepID=A0A0V1MIW7_9BILA|nr:hypothetical protein T10_9482 [Trichinella papuae]